MSEVSKKRAAEIAAIPDERIDYSDIPEVPSSFWETARLVVPGLDQHEPEPVDQARFWRGIRNGCLISIPFWLLIAVIGWAVWIG